jgi:hypothetical protein
MVSSVSQMLETIMKARSILSALALTLITVSVRAGTIVCSGTIDTLQFEATSTGSGYFSIK